MQSWLKHLNLFRPDARGPESVLGDLETAVMDVCWSRGEVAIKDVHDVLSGSRTIAYTTVQTTMERLYRKEMLKRVEHGRNFRYLPAATRDEFLAGVARHVLAALFGNFPEPTMASLVDLVQDGDSEQLERLIQALDTRRARGEE